MLFKKKYIIDCIIKCIDKNIIYSIDANGKNISTCEYQFAFIDQDRSKILYKYDENSTLYEINKHYKAKFNEQFGTFEVCKLLKGDEL